MRWAAVVPLIGGQLVGSERAFGTPPAEIASFSPFAHNDSFTRRRWPNTPFRILDEGQKLTGNYDAVVSVCPCAGLSMLSIAKPGTEAREKKNQWMFDAAEYVLGEVKPGVYLGENAPALFTTMGTSVAKRMADVAKKHGYSLSFYRTDARSHGLPQRRIRTFYYFWRNDVSPKLTWFDRDMIPAKEYLALLDKDADRIDEPSVRDLKGEMSYQYLRQKYGDRWRSAGEDENPYTNVLVMMDKKQMLRDFVNWAPNKKDHVVQAAAKMMDNKGAFSFPPTFDKEGSYPAVMKKTVVHLVHPTEDRYLNMRETAWLMGLPKDYPIPIGEDFNVLCQNVPVESARDASLIAKDWLSGKLEDSNEKVMWFDNESKQEYHTIDRLTPKKKMDATAANHVFG